MFLAKTRSWEIPLFLAYMLLLFVSNIANDFVVRPYVTRSIPNPYLQALVGPVWTAMFWIISTILYLIYMNQRNPLAYVKLTTNLGKGLLWALAGGLWFVLALSYRHLLQGIPINLHLSLAPGSI
jgi:hypothetical protein